jgi:hypothetical protein
VRPPHGKWFRVNPPGTGGIPGSISGHILVYAQTRGRAGNPFPRPDASRIAFYDLAKRKALPTPRGVHRAGWDESMPSYSGHWLMYLRTKGDPNFGVYRERLVLRNLATRTETRLWSHYGQVRGRYAAWQDSCSSTIDDLATAKRVSAGSCYAASVVQLFPSLSVTRTGVVYRAINRKSSQVGTFIEAADLNGRISRIPVAGPVSDVYADDTVKPTRIYYTRLSGGGVPQHPWGDIWVVTDPNS